MTDWSPSDPDAVRVVYDLSSWSIDQQAELASELADAEVPHAWEGTELVVPEEAEQAADLVIADVEGRLGISEGDTADAGEAEAADELDAPDPIALTEGVPSTEYDLAEWPPSDRMTLTHALVRAEIPYRWEGQHVLLVGTPDEDVVDELLDAIERGDFSDADASGARAADQLPFETLSTFFLAGERLRKDPLDADGIEQLLAAMEVADPATPPYGVQPRLWARVCDLADRLSVALVGGDADDEADESDDGDTADAAEGRAAIGSTASGSDEDPFDHDLAVDVANQLHDLLRPYV
jgi:hypothetical protein